MRDYSDYAMKQSEFFKAFTAGGDSLKGKCHPLMLKVKDYPPEAAFAEEMPRHWQVSTNDNSDHPPAFDMQTNTQHYADSTRNAGARQIC